MCLMLCITVMQYFCAVVCDKFILYLFSIIRILISSFIASLFNALVLFIAWQEWHPVCIKPELSNFQNFIGVRPVWNNYSKFNQLIETKTESSSRVSNLYITVFILR